MESSTPSHAERVTRLRLKLTEAMRLGVLPANFKDFYETTLLQILNESEKNRQNCLAAAQHLREQAKAEEAKAQAFTMTASMVQSVVNGFVDLETKRVVEEAERTKEKAEAAAEASGTSQSPPAEPPPEPKPARKKRG